MDRRKEALNKGEMLKVAYRELNQIFNTAANGMRVIDKDFNVVRANERFCMLSGVSMHEATAKKCYEVFSGPQCHSSDCPMVRILKGEERVEYEIEKVRKDGTKVSCILTAASFHGNGDGAVGIVEDFKDITDLKRIEEEIRKQQKMLKQFSRKILSIREEEKKKFSNDLHDEIGSMVISLSANLLICEEQIRNNDLEAAFKGINETRSALKEAVRHLKIIAKNARPPILDRLSLPKALKELFMVTSSRTGLRIDFDSDVRYKRLHDDLKTALYRVAQEALNNVVAHACARSVKARLYSKNGELNFWIADDGKGFDPEGNGQSAKESNIGIFGMRERIESVGGVFDIETAPKLGTKISISLPLKKEKGK